MVSANNFVGTKRSSKESRNLSTFHGRNWRLQKRFLLQQSNHRSIGWNSGAGNFKYSLAFIKSNDLLEGLIIFFKNI